jgi:dipeptidase D
VLASAPDGLRLAALDGGVSRNAIPRNACALVAVPNEDAFRASAVRALAVITRRHAGTDGALAVTIEHEAIHATVSSEATRNALDVRAALPTGVLAMSPNLSGVVETSSSLTTAVTDGMTLTLGSMTRSSNSAALDEVLETMHALARLGGATIEVRRSYGPWEPRLDSRLLTTAKASYARLFATEPALTVVHGGLECAVLGQKLPGVQMISIGPEIVGPHAPGERVRISSTQRFYRLLGGLVDDLSC